MKNITLLTLAILFSLGLFSQELIIQVKEFNEEGWRYVTVDDKRIGDKVYKKCYPFSKDGLAIIINNERISFINTKGDEILPEIQNFTMYKPDAMFSDGMLAVQKDKKWGYLDLNGKLVIPLKYDKATPFNNGYAMVMKNKGFFIINKKGEETAVNIKDIVKMQRFTDSLAPYYRKDKKWGFIGIDGTEAIPATYKSVGYFHNGIAWARNKEGKIGFINKKGNWVLEPIYDAAKKFDNESGMARVKLKGKWGYVNKKAEFLKVETEKWGDFKDGLAKGKKGDFVGFYDNTGKWVIDASLQASRKFSNGYCAAKLNEMWGLINKNGEWVIEPKYERIRDLQFVE